MYRSIGLYAVRAGVDPHDADAVAALLPQVKLGIRLIDGAQHILFKRRGRQHGHPRRGDRHGCVRRGRTPRGAASCWTPSGLAESQNILMDGRDIGGTVVLPNATVKIFLTASAEPAPSRCELAEKGQPADFATVLADIRQRDYQDSHRAVAPLKQADDAILGGHKAASACRRALTCSSARFLRTSKGLTMLLYWIFAAHHLGAGPHSVPVRGHRARNLKAVRDGRAYVIAPNHIANLDPVFDRYNDI